MPYTGPVVDTHHHFWDLERFGDHYKWINNIPADAKDAGLKRSYLLPDFERDIQDLNVTKSVHVQGEWRGDEVEETRWLDGIAEDVDNSAGFPHAIVGYANFDSPDVENQLQEHAKSPRFRGVRQLLNWHEDESKRAAERDYLSDPEWRERIGLLAKYNLLFELHLYPHQMAQASALCKQHPTIPFVLDHIGCPIERDGPGYDSWLHSMKDLASNANAYCKISGLIHPMHTSKGGWSAETLRPWIKGTLEAFGTDRCLFGSNFPVDGVCGSYKQVLDAVKACLDELGVSASDQHSIFYANARSTHRRTAEMADVQKRKRAFRKFTFRGIEVEQLLDLSHDQLLDLLNCRARRKLKRGLKRKPLSLLKKLRKVKKETPEGEKPAPVKTHLRNMIILPEMIGSIVGVYNGKTFNQVEIRTDMVGHYLGEFSISYKPVRHGRPGIGATNSSRFIPLK
ncbi:ribosomal protein S15 [Salpingoeca rosetta]|uniref:Ribosomal protein S15 n=1 Tax=Salpingoeca rosetta (strain ATCC 50818 / BSB-021) TaxID=946362 RepID=F2U0Y8_SALR5|nr:ribosomal protein S15 [Salpingoeca rosetta]EGD80562.1 ribosomal protein S15 [Salpingoeca rosetta]|eukprot:XP_004997123.1 ribosomal protein S15 [Salpingoeca rosetta]